MRTKLKKKIEKLIRNKKTFSVIQTGKTIKVLVEKHKKSLKVIKTITTFENGEMISKQLIKK